jgi:hypothetical protein
MKRCSCCKKFKSIVMFGNNRCQNDGLDNYCKVCRREYHRIACAKNRAKFNTPIDYKPKQIKQNTSEKLISLKIKILYEQILLVNV